MSGAIWPNICLFGLGPGELLLVFLVLVLLFGARKIPEIAQGMGKGIREFKKAMRDTEDEIKSEIKDNNSKKIDPNNKQNG
jgi:sec-independent protein translocase protein TatA